MYSVLGLSFKARRRKNSSEKDPKKIEEMLENAKSIPELVRKGARRLQMNIEIVPKRSQKEAPRDKKSKQRFQDDLGERTKPGRNGGQDGPKSIPEGSAKKKQGKYENEQQSITFA